MLFTTTTFFTILLTATSTLASPLLPRGNTPVDPNSITGLTCTTLTPPLDFHSTNVALLSICGSIAGKIEKCNGSPTTTTGVSGTSKFTLTAVNAAQGATINVSKGRWEHCVAAARAGCGEGNGASATCIGGTSDGAGFTFTLGTA